MILENITVLFIIIDMKKYPHTVYYPCGAKSITYGSGTTDVFRDGGKTIISSIPEVIGLEFKRVGNYEYEKTGAVFKLRRRSPGFNLCSGCGSRLTCKK